MAKTLLCCFALFFVCPGEGSQFQLPNSNSLWLDQGNNYQLSWRVNKPWILFRVKVQTAGWIAFGISKKLSGKIEGADFAVGWINKHGKAVLMDCHGTQDGLSKLDSQQDWRLVTSQRTGNETRLEFKRRLVTCDKYDRDIKERTAKIIYGWGEKHPQNALDACSVLSSNSSNFKSRSINLLNSGIKKDLPAGTKYVDLFHREVRVPQKKTTYWCTPFRIDRLINLTTPKHFIEIHPVSQKREKEIVHHLVLYACDDLSEKDLAYDGECYSTDAPPSIKRCAGTGGIFAYGIGGVNFRFPDNVGYPIGTKDSSKYFVLESHFNNEELRKDLVDTTGFRMFYGEPRKHEAAMLTIGASVTDNLIIPPGLSRWTLKGVCTKSCTKKMDQGRRFSEKSIKIFATFPHAHDSAIAIRTTVVRNGREVEDIVRNDNFDPAYQQVLVMNKEVEVKAGDEIFTSCTYRTKNRTFTTLGGMGSDREMCFNFMMYYPKVNLTTCTSDEMVVQPAFTSSYANPAFPKCIDKSHPLENWQMANWTGVTWTKSMVKELYDFYNKDDPLPLVMPRCLGINAHYYKLPAEYRPVIRRRLPARKSICRRTKKLKLKR